MPPDGGVPLGGVPLGGVSEGGVPLGGLPEGGGPVGVLPADGGVLGGAEGLPGGATFWIAVKLHCASIVESEILSKLKLWLQI